MHLVKKKMCITHLVLPFLLREARTG